MIIIGSAPFGGSFVKGCGARLKQAPCYLSVSKPLKVMLDIRYQYAIIVPLSGHDFLVPRQPCAPAKRFF